MSEHTKEPWRTDAPSGFPGDVMAGKEMIARTTITEQSNAKANARRIVACVNACKRFSTELLEAAAACGGIPADPTAELIKAEQQRDKLLAALEDLQVRYTTLFGLYAPLTYHESSKQQEDLDIALATSNAAIAKVKP